MKNKHCTEYPNFENTIQPVLHSNEISILKFKGLPTQELVKYVPKNIVMYPEESDTNFNSSIFESQNKLQKFNQAKLNDLAKKKKKKKRAAEDLASRLKREKCNYFRTEHSLVYFVCERRWRLNLTSKD